MATEGEYRCPNCLKRNLPGLRFGFEFIGLPYLHGMLMPDWSVEYQRIYCLKCLQDGVAGIRGAIGLVAIWDEGGWELLLGERDDNRADD